MKKLCLATILSLLAAALPAQVRFEKFRTPDTIRKEAQRSGKLVFIDLFATWCAPCRLMDELVFSSQEVGDFMNERFVCAKYNIDRGTGRELMHEYGTGSVPTYLIFNTEGELLGRIIGASSAEEFTADIQSIIDRQKPRNSK